MAYATLEQVLDYINKKTFTSDEEVALLGYIDAATNNIDRVLNVWREGFEYFAAPSAASTRLFVARGGHTVMIDYCVSVTLVEERYNDDWETVASTDYVAGRGSGRFARFDPPYNLLIAEPGYAFPGKRHTSHPRANLRVTARWGYSATVPADIAAACIEQAGRWFKRAQSAMSDTLADGDTGLLLYTKALDPDIERKLSHGRYYRPALGGW